MRISSISYINGFLGTVILHLLIGIVFYSAKISGIYSQTAKIIVETPESVRQEQEIQQKKPSQREIIDRMTEAFIASQRRNIGVNQSGKEPAIMEKDLQQIQEDIDIARKQIASVQENLDKQDNLIESNTDEGKPITNAPKKTEKIQGKLAVYKGPTNIYYDLANRRDINLYVPVYKCQGNGRVVVNINVNQAGEVENAAINKLASDNDDCLFDAALDAAKRSHFNTDFKNAPLKQKGTITYLFVAQ